MKRFLTVIAAATMLFTASAQAKWWIFGKSGEGVGFRYVYFNGVSMDEIPPKSTMYTDLLKNGQLAITGKAYAGKNQIGYVRISTNNKGAWQKVKLSSNGSFEYSFTPEPDKPYIFHIEAVDTAGQVNDVELTRREIVFSSVKVRQAVSSVLDALLAAYGRQDAAAFMSYVSDDFTGDPVNLDRAIRKDFSLFTRTEITTVINNVTSNKKGLISVTLNFNRFLVAKRTGASLKDSGVTEFVFSTGEKGLLLYSMKFPLLFGVSEPSEIAQGVVNTGANQNTIVVDAAGNITVAPFNTAVTGAGEETYTEKAATVAGTEHVIYMTTDFGVSSFRFSDQSTSPEPTLPISNGDFVVLNDTFYTRSGVGMQDLGVKAVSTVRSAPTSGYITSGPGGVFISWQVGHCYAFRLADGTMGVLEAKPSYDMGEPPIKHYPFNYKYQPDGTPEF